MSSGLYEGRRCNNTNSLQTLRSSCVKLVKLCSLPSNPLGYRSRLPAFPVGEWSWQQWVALRRLVCCQVGQSFCEGPHFIQGLIHGLKIRKRKRARGRAAWRSPDFSPNTQTRQVFGCCGFLKNQITDRFNTRQQAEGSRSDEATWAENQTDSTSLHDDRSCDLT